jgi:small-conductance mechanosensitive channel
MATVARLLSAALLWLATAVFAVAQNGDPWFEIGALNLGLGAAPDNVDRRTPRTTIESFLAAGDAEDWDAAAHLLDLQDVPPELQAQEGPILAYKLHSVLERKAVLDWNTLRQRPDALQPLGGQQEALAGEPRRSLLIRELDLWPVPASIRLNRVRPGEATDPVWIFPQETVADIPALFRAYGPSAFEQRLPSWTLEQGIWSLMWWELIGLPLLIAAAVLLGWTVFRLLDALRMRLDGANARGVVRAARWPAVILAVTVLVSAVANNLFVFSGQIDAFLSPLIAVGYVTAILMLFMGAVDAVLDNTFSPEGDLDLTDSLREEARAKATRLNAFKRIVSVLVFLIGAGIVLSQADLFQGLGLSILASAGALTLIVGFAARSILGNILCSLQIALNQSARVGDRVEWRDYLAYVERIHLTYVQLRHWDGTRVIVPVEEFVSETFSNWSMEEPEMLRFLKFKLDPDVDLEALRAAFFDILDDLSDDAEIGEALGDRADAKMNVVDQDVFGLDVWFFLPCMSPNTSWAAACAVRERLVHAMREIADRTGRPVFPEGVAAEAA